MAKKTSKSDVVAILAFLQSSLPPAFEHQRRVLDRSDSTSSAESIKRQLELAEQRRVQKRDRRAAQFKKAV
jgi:hypothetical protein